MARVIAGMTVSVDGFVADQHGDAGALYRDLKDLRSTSYMQEMIDETGAALMGRRTFEMAEDPDELADSYEFQVPLVILTSAPPARTPKENERLTFTFVSEGLGVALARAREAAGEKAVTVVGGPTVIRQLLDAGEVDELRLDVVPIVLGSGLRLTDGWDPRRVHLEKLSVVEVGARTSLRFRVTTSP